MTKALFCIPVAKNSMSDEKLKRLSINSYRNIGYVQVEPDSDTEKLPKNSFIKILSYNIFNYTNESCNKSRSTRISDVILSDKPDFAMLQGVYNIKDAIDNVRLEETYNVLYVQRGKGIHNGCLTLYDKSRFLYVQGKLVLLDDEALNHSHLFGEGYMHRFKNRNVLHLMIFQDILNNFKHVCVCNTQFESDNSLDDVKYFQMVQV